MSGCVRIGSAVAFLGVALVALARALHLGGDLHAHIDEDLWAKEAELMEFFNRSFVMYHGMEVHQSIPRQIVEAQRITHYTIDGERFERVRYGDESPEFEATVCHDCAVVAEQFHRLGCDWEKCPRCGGQALTCACLYAEYPEKVPLFAT